MDGLADIRVRFTPGKPFMPFQQLLAVLPAASCGLLPKPFEARAATLPDCSGLQSRC